MSTNKNVPEIYPGIYAGLSWIVLGLLVAAGIWYSWEVQQQSDFAVMLRNIPSPYPTLIGTGILVLMMAVYAGSVQRTMNSLVACLSEEAAGRVERHLLLFILGILLKLVAIGGSAWLVWKGWETAGGTSAGETEMQLFLCYLLLVVLLGAAVYAWGSLMTAQSWNGGAADALASER